jgi:hypothetical protein
LGRLSGCDRALSSRLRSVPRASSQFDLAGEPITSRVAEKRRRVSLLCEPDVDVRFKENDLQKSILSAALIALAAVSCGSAAQEALACTRIFANDKGRCDAGCAQHGLGDDYGAGSDGFSSRARARRRPMRLDCRRDRTGLKFVDGWGTPCPARHRPSSHRVAGQRARPPFPLSSQRYCEGQPG